MLAGLCAQSHWLSTLSSLIRVTSYGDLVKLNKIVFISWESLNIQLEFLPRLYIAWRSRGCIYGKIQCEYRFMSRLPHLGPSSLLLSWRQQKIVWVSGPFPPTWRPQGDIFQPWLAQIWTLWLLGRTRWFQIAYVFLFLLLSATHTFTWINESLK